MEMEKETHILDFKIFIGAANFCFRIFGVKNLIFEVFQK